MSDFSYTESNESIMLPIHRLLPFSNVEGSGNRSSIFLQGCNLNCLYCHNSETIPLQSSLSKKISITDIVEFVKKSIPFIRGITVSGGEPTLHDHALKLLFDEIHKLNLTCYIDTNGFFDFQQKSDLIQVTDKFLFDVKGDDNGLKEVCFSGQMPSHFSEKTIFNNLEQLLLLDKIEEVRFVLIKDFFHEEALIEKIAMRLKFYPLIPLRIIPIHLKGMNFNRMKMVKEHVPTLFETEELRTLARQAGIHIVR